MLGSSITALALLRAAHALRQSTTIVDLHRGIATRSRTGRKIILDSRNDASILNILSNLAEEQPSFLIADSDNWLRFIQLHRSELESVFLEVLHPPTSVLSVCLDKTQFYDWCREENILTPTQYLLRHDGSLLPPPKFPLLVRPNKTIRNSKSPIPKAVEAQSNVELQYWLEMYSRERVAPHISESLLNRRAKQLSICIVRDRKGQSRSCVTEKLRPTPEQLGVGSHVAVTVNADVEAMARLAIEKLDYYGICECEIMVVEDEAYFIEINARPWLQFGLAEKAGCDFLRFLLLGDCENHPSPKQGLRWLFFSPDFYYCMSRDDGLVTQGRLSFPRYLLSLISVNVYAIWSYKDPLPFFYHLFSFAKDLLTRNVRPFR